MTPLCKVVAVFDCLVCCRRGTCSLFLVCSVLRDHSGRCFEVMLCSVLGCCILCRLFAGTDSGVGHGWWGLLGACAPASSEVGIAALRAAFCRVATLAASEGQWLGTLYHRSWLIRSHYIIYSYRSQAYGSSHPFALDHSVGELLRAFRTKGRMVAMPSALHYWCVI